MSKRILLIDSDESFAQGLSSAISARGFHADVATDSEHGISLARSEAPDLIVVCVEAQPTNGYMLCTRLKKDEQLKAIPVILTSANATPDSFEKHKKLKTRAEEYLIKPFAPSVMLEKAASLMGVELPGDEDEMVTSVEDEPLGLGDLVEGEDEPISLSEHDAREARSGLAEEAEVVEEVEEVVSIEEARPAGGDDDLDVFDQAFDNLAPAGGKNGEEETALGQLHATPHAEELAVEDDDAPSPPTELSAPDDEAVLDGLIGEGHGEDDDALELLQSSPPARSAKPAPKPASKSPAPRREPATGRGNGADLEAQLAELRADADKREAANKSLQQRADALAAAAKKFERELGQAKKELDGAGAHRSKVDELETELETARAEVARLSEQLEAARTEIAALTGEKDLLAEERDQLHRQLAEVAGSAEQNEERAVQAYQQLKEGEKLREKARQALQIALRLLDENASPDDAGSALEGQ